MFAYILRAPGTPRTEETDEFFRRFVDTPGLVHAFDLQGVDDPEDVVVLAVWEDRDAAQRYLTAHPLRQEVDEKLPTITRTMYDVIGSK
ncbi:MAG TPA: hypothetical protein VLA10_05810 [Ilumatobacter sp.]|nr:hypothetical protein [Ilumatobacter sp.]